MHFWRYFGIYSNIKILVFLKGQILRLFSGLAFSRLKICKKKNTLMVAYVHIENSTYQLSEELKGAEIYHTPTHHPPPMIP